MKKLMLLILSVIYINILFAQLPQVDSLSKILASTKNDTLKVNLLVKLSFYIPNFERGLDFANSAYQLAKKIHYEKGEANALHQIGNCYISISNYPASLHYFVESLEKSEQIDDKKSIAVSYVSIAGVYQLQEDYQNAISYLRKAESTTIQKNYQLAIADQQFGQCYAAIKKADSALFYFQRSYEEFNAGEDKFQFNLTLNGLGDLQVDAGNNELALAYYHQSEKNGIAYADTFGLSYTYLKIAQLFNKEKKTDSAIINAQKSLLYAQHTNVPQNIVAAGKLLATLYENNNDKEALRYSKISQAAADSLYGRARTNELQNMFLNETQRETEVAEREKLADEERKQNIQYAAIALGIIVFITLFLLLSRTIIVTERLISFFAILGLLVVFEFINLIIHPWLISVTGESPVLMLLALVIIASLLIPLHHRLEHWIKEKMIEKNKKIRLAAARRTIEKLEKE
jgi:tetratricopeptide (TPR) repeat protein